MLAYLNIGLNVRGTEPENMLNRVLRILTLHGGVRGLALQAGEWEGVPERSVQVKIELYGDPVATAAVLASYLEQDGVAWLSALSPDEWRVVNARGITVATGTLADFPIITT